MHDVYLKRDTVLTHGKIEHLPVARQIVLHDLCLPVCVRLKLSAELSWLCAGITCAIALLPRIASSVRSESEVTQNKAQYE